MDSYHIPFGDSKKGLTEFEFGTLRNLEFQTLFTFQIEQVCFMSPHFDPIVINGVTQPYTVLHAHVARRQTQRTPRQKRNTSLQPLTSVENATANSGRETATLAEIRAGEIWHVNFGGRVGKRYALVLCSPYFARADVMVCPLTTQLKPRAKSRVRLNVPCASSDIQSEIKCEEIHTVPQSSMHRCIGKCPAATFIMAQQALARILFGQSVDIRVQ
jgi:mRNA-degrading endonuclease toxin of MazEF toxin-antitoxin module